MYKTKKGIPIDSTGWPKGKAERLLKRGIIVADKKAKEEKKEGATKEDKEVKQTKKK